MPHVVSKEKDDIPPGRRQRRAALRQGDEVQVSQYPRVELQGRKRDAPCEGKGNQMIGDGFCARIGEVFEDEALVLVECFR